MSYHFKLSNTHKHPLFFLCVSASLSACTAPSALYSEAGYALNPVSQEIIPWDSQQTGRIIMQENDYSCGAAALATMMTYYFQNSVSELDILGDIEHLFNDDEKALIQSAGLSMTELGTIAQARGYQSAAIQLDPAALPDLPGPIIIFLRTNEYRHFAVLREVVDGKARIADPSRGNITLTIDELLRDWHGETLVLGSEGFGVPKKHGLLAEVRAVHNVKHNDILPSRLSPFISIPR